MANANEVLGFLHGCYGLGAVLSPLIATTMITKGQRLPWYTFYYVMVRIEPNDYPRKSHAHSPSIDWVSRHRTRDLSRCILVCHRRRVPQEQRAHDRQQRQPYEGSSDTHALRAHHLDLRHVPAGLRRR